MLKLFTKPIFDDEISREEIHTYHPHTRAFNYNDEIEITINQKDTLMAMYDAALYLQGKILIEATAAANATGGVAPAVLAAPNELLILNYGSYLFESMTYELNGKEIEKVRDPGIISTIRAFMCLSPNECRTYQTAGWNWPVPTACAIDNNTFNLLIPLKFFFGVFEDYKKVICGKHTLKLVRARSDNNCYRTITNNETLSITLTAVELKVKHIYPNDDVRLRLYDQIKVDHAIYVPYRKWELHELPTLSKSKKEIWPVKTSTQLEKPRYIIIAFHKNRYNAQDEDCSYFDNINLISLRAYLNSECYPYEPVKCNFSENQYIEPYQNYCKFQKYFQDVISTMAPQPLLDYAAFKSRALFVIDCSKQNESLRQTTVDLKLEFESDKEFPTNTRAYCVIIHDCLIEYKPMTETVRNVI